MKSAEIENSNSAPAATLSNSVRANRERWFYLWATVLLLVAVFLGFKLFYLHGQAYPGRPLTPPIRSMIITHGVSMSAWMLLLLVQSVLVVNRKVALHRTLGSIGAFLAAVVVVSGWRLAVHAARVNPPEIKLWGMNPTQFLSVPLSAVVIFAIFVGIAIWKRKDLAIHRPLIFTGTLAAVSAAMDRIGPLTSLYHDTFMGALLGPYFGPFALGAVLLGIKSAITGKFDRWFAVGIGVIALAGFAIMHGAQSPAWVNLATRLMP